MNSEAERKLRAARVSLIFDHPFFGHLALNLELTEKGQMYPPTMATNGFNLYYHPEFVMGCSQPELSGVICHEIGHIILHHITRRQHRDKMKWNLACDFAVNYLIDREADSSLKLPDGVLREKKFDNKTSEWIYDQLPDPIKITIQCTLDSHEEWGELGNGNGKNGKDGATKDGKDEEGTGKDDDQKRPFGGVSLDDLEQQWREHVAQAATHARMQGKLPAHLQTIIDGILQPKLDWKTILRDMVTSCAASDFRIVPPNKRHMWRELYLPSVTGEEISIAAVIDSSGSISDELLKEFLGEIKGICDAYEYYTIYLFVCDAKIQQRFELHPFDPLPKTIEGRGGTSFVEPIEEAAKLPISSLVYLTDLYGTFPEKEPWFPVIWVATSDEKVPWGKIIRIEDKS